MRNLFQRERETLRTLLETQSKLLNVEFHMDIHSKHLKDVYVNKWKLETETAGGFYGAAYGGLLPRGGCDQCVSCLGRVTP